MSAKIICVFNNPEVFEKVVKNNKNLEGCELIAYDNTSENIAITKRYNSFIEEYISAPAHEEEEQTFTQFTPFWCLFIHQDFGILENVLELTKKLDPQNIYGAVGIKTFYGIFWGKNGLEQKKGLKNKLKVMFGRILQGNNDFTFHGSGCPLPSPVPVDVIDCCCIMIHSSLIKKHNLRFDENLDFHMYAEELCYRTNKDYGIKTMAVQTKCFHMGIGSLNEDYQKAVQYLKDKFQIDEIPSTCPN